MKPRYTLTDPELKIENGRVWLQSGEDDERTYWVGFDAETAVETGRTLCKLGIRLLGDELAARTPRHDPQEDAQ